QRLLPSGSSLSSEEVDHEVDVPPMLDLRERLFSQAQPNVFFAQVSVAELDAGDELLFSPAIEPISRAGSPFQARNKFLGFSFKEILGFLVVRVDHYGKTEAQPLFDVLGSQCRQTPFGRTLKLAGLEEDLDSLFQFVLAQPGRGRNPDCFCK